MEAWTPTLKVRQAHGRCRLDLGGYAYGDGDTLQDAADALITRLLTLAMGWRSRPSFTFLVEVGPPDRCWLEFVHELSQIAARGDDIRERVFGFADEADQAA